MLLSSLIRKSLIFDKTPRGVCIAIGIAPKNKRIKYLFCSPLESGQNTPSYFALPLTALSSISEHSLILSRMRPVLPQNYLQLTLGMPIYSESGKYLGSLIDVKFSQRLATSLQTESGWHNFSRVLAIGDAVILRREQPYPIGQPTQENFVTKHTLKKAVKEQSLIKLTLSLPPFSLS